MLRSAFLLWFAFLTGCGAGALAPPAAPPQARPVPDPVALSLAGSLMPLALPDRQDSWMSPRAHTGPLIYVSDWSTRDVFVYNYLNDTMVGLLTGFKGPYGQCVDAKGNVWIADFKERDVVEFAHGEKTPLARLHTNGYPIGCSFDPGTGSLAVANFYTPKGSGNIQIWKHPSGPPVIFRPKKLFYLWPPVYDDRGNLFVEGRTSDGAYGVAELPEHAAALLALALHGATIRFAAAAVWDGRHIGLTDQNADFTDTTEIYLISVSGQTARIVGRVRLTDSCLHDRADVVQPFAVPNGDARSDTVIGGNIWCPNRFNYWSYPAGGNPKESLHHAPAEPFGQSLSPATDSLH